MNEMMTREEIIMAFRKITELYARDDLTSAELEGKLNTIHDEIERRTLDPGSLDYLYAEMGKTTPEEIADKILSYQPIRL